MCLRRGGPRWQCLHESQGGPGARPASRGNVQITSFGTGGYGFQIVVPASAATLSAPMPGGIGSGAGTMAANFQSFSVLKEADHPAGSDALTAASSGFRFVSQREGVEAFASNRIGRARDEPEQRWHGDVWRDQLVSEYGRSSSTSRAA
jgi:hypothetical protein